MKQTPPVSGGAGSAGGGKGSSAEGSLAPHPCPYGDDCRRLWTALPDDSGAECGYCYQTLSRADLARILEGRA